MGCVLGTGMLGPKRGEMVLKRKGRFFVKERPFLGILVCFSALLKKRKAESYAFFRGKKDISFSPSKVKLKA